MDWMQNKYLAGGLIAALAAFGSSCSAVVENDFDEVLGFNGFFADIDCGTGLSEGLIILANVALEEEDSQGICVLGSSCGLTAELENFTTGDPLPGDGAQGAEGSPVPSNDGVRIQIKRIRIEHALPFGELPGRESAYNANIEPGGELCVGFRVLDPDDLFTMAQNPEDFPTPPFSLTTRVTFEGVTEGGLSIRTQSDFTYRVDPVDPTIDQ